MLQKILHSNFMVRLRQWEYWPFSVIYAPVFLYWLFLSLKARSLFFFRAANPGIETGGMLGESKIKIMDMLPEAYKPVTLFFNSDATAKDLMDSLRENSIDFPVIIKPDIGERGWLVEKIHDRMELQKYMSACKVNVLVQEFVDLPVELAVMYYRFPGMKEGRVMSVTIKEFLSVQGDGKNSLEKLILNLPRAKLQYEALKDVHAQRFGEVPLKGESVELMPIGNHCRGAKFLNGNHTIDKKMERVFDNITDTLEGVYFCRYDLKCTGIEELKEGREIKIMEINGVGAEPAHIYDPGYRLIQAWRDLFEQWDIIYKISRTNKMNGDEYMTLGEAYKAYRDLSRYKKMAT